MCSGKLFEQFYEKSILRSLSFRTFKWTKNFLRHLTIQARKKLPLCISYPTKLLYIQFFSLMPLFLIDRVFLELFVSPRSTTGWHGDVYRLLSTWSHYESAWSASQSVRWFPVWPWSDIAQRFNDNKKFFFQIQLNNSIVLFIFKFEWF